MKYNKIIKTIFTLAILVIGTCQISFADIATDAKLQYNKGIDYYQLGQFEEAASCFKKATELDPNYIDAYYNLGSILEYLKQDEAALAVFKQIILRKPDDYESVYKAAELSKKLGEYDKAKMYLTLIPQDSLIGSRAKELATQWIQVFQRQKLNKHNLKHTLMQHRKTIQMECTVIFQAQQVLLQIIEEICMSQVFRIIQFTKSDRTIKKLSI